ncbi:hypothetical protein DSO57_1018918 [Entomophthora muscae]|uniref:Uncharacterized protein n=1 Tax=Entomophthora muscae TaxID=34485 RepID=A0ACC2SH27_9FUNG|nr:hypothetical protein DSO57_1018918 [Entomophthora muscae]
MGYLPAPDRAGARHQLPPIRHTGGSLYQQDLGILAARVKKSTGQWHLVDNAICNHPAASRKLDLPGMGWNRSIFICRAREW